MEVIGAGQGDFGPSPVETKQTMVITFVDHFWVCLHNSYLYQWIAYTGSPLLLGGHWGRLCRIRTLMGLSV